MNSKPLPPSSYLWELFDYNPLTGDLYWKKRRVGVKRNKPAGCERADGRRTLRIDGVSYWAHRIIWCWMSGNDPGEMEVDHADTNHSNNAWINLRLATSSQQKQNRCGSGRYLKGTAPTKNSKKWRAYIGNKHIGVYETEKEAHQAYLEQAITHYGEFANPT